MQYKLTFREYSEALKENKLLGLKCHNCDTVTAPPRMVCRKCGSSEMEIIELTGNGKNQTFTVINIPAEGREEECPYIVVLVELDEGPWIMGNLVDIEPEEASMELIGQRVKMSGSKVFAGDKYSAGDGARPVFSLEA